MFVQKIAQRRIKRMENKSQTIVLSLKYVLLAILPVYWLESLIQYLTEDY